MTGRKAPLDPALSNYLARIGRKGGKARARMSPVRRRELARKAARARWSRPRSKKTGAKPAS